MKDKILFWFGFRTFKKNTGDEKKITSTKQESGKLYKTLLKN